MRLDRRNSAQSKRLAQILGCHKNEAFGWFLALIEDVDKWSDPGPTYYPGGPTDGYLPPVIKNPPDAELGADWEGEPGLLIEAMCSAGFLERQADGSVIVLEYWETFVGAHVWNRLRQGYFRNQKSKKKRPNKRNVTVTLRSRHTNTDTDTDTDTHTNADTDTDTDREHPPATLSDVGGATHNRKEPDPEKKEERAFEGGKGDVRAGGKAAGFPETLALPKRGQDARREMYLDSIMKTTGDGEHLRRWWGEVYDKMNATTDGLETLKTVWAKASISPPFCPENPGAYIAARCKAHLKGYGQRLPKKPAA